jgi:hypothetical protein
MQRIEVLRDGGILEGVFGNVFELKQPMAKPIFCAAQPALFARPPVDRAVRQCVRIPGHRYGRLSSERGQCRQRAVEAVVASSRDSVPTVVDEVPVVVRSWVGMHEVVALRIAERILYRGLVRGILEVV